MAPIKNFISPKIYFNKGGIDQLSNFIGNYRVGKDEYCVVFIDEFFEGTDINLLGDTENIITYYVSTEIEPETALIDMYVEKIKIQDKKISCIVGIGGGIVMDVAKAISIMLTNDGKTENYQGWDLVANNYHLYTNPSPQNKRQKKKQKKK
jgi:3-deoxy-alpha-D-manno-octulosonate 8-oxidase